jgi:hypothetical protein
MELVKKQLVDAWEGHLYQIFTAIGNQSLAVDTTWVGRICKELLELGPGLCAFLG